MFGWLRNVEQGADVLAALDVAAVRAGLKSALFREAPVCAPFMRVTRVKALGRLVATTQKHADTQPKNTKNPPKPALDSGYFLDPAPF